jgi:hypothetical protein
VLKLSDVNLTRAVRVERSHHRLELRIRKNRQGRQTRAHGHAKFLRRDFATSIGVKSSR